MSGRPSATVARALAPIGLVVCLLAAWAVLGGGATKPTHHVERCAPGSAVLSFVRYDLGDRFDGLALDDRSELCFPGGPPPAPQTIPVSSRTYGTCEPSGGEGGCGPPLEIQSWPACGRHPSRPRPGPWLPGLVARVTPRLARLAPDLARQLPSLASPTPRLPPAVGQELRRLPVSPIAGQIELYAPDTTIVVFSETPGGRSAPRRGDDAAAVLAIKAVLNAQRASAGRPVRWPVAPSGCRAG